MHTTSRSCSAPSFVRNKSIEIGTPQRKKLKRFNSTEIFHQIVSKSPPSSDPKWVEKKTVTIDLTSVETLTNKKAIGSFDRQLRSDLWNYWKNVDKPSVSALQIESDIYSLCRKEITTLFQNNITSPTLCDDTLEQSLMEKTLLLIQQSDITVNNIVKRLNLILESIGNELLSHQTKTPWSESLFSDLQKLIKTGTFEPPITENKNNLQKFTLIAEKFLSKRVHQKIHPLIVQAFGDTTKDSVILNTLKKWGKPTTETLLTLQKYIREIYSNNIHAANIPKIIHTCPISKHFPEFLNKISLEQIIRSLKVEGGNIYESIQINGNKLSLGHDMPCRKFFELLLMSIYKGGLAPDIKEKEIRRHAVSLSTREPPRCQAKSFLPFGEIPGLTLLKLMSMDSWGCGFIYMNKIYPHIFQPPYYTSLMQGSKCLISIESPNHYKVTQKKMYRIYPLNEPEDPLSSPQKNRPLVDLPISWAVCYANGHIVGELQIEKKEFRIFDNVSSKDEWAIFNHLITFVRVSLLETL